MIELSVKVMSELNANHFSVNLKNNKNKKRKCEMQSSNSKIHITSSNYYAELDVEDAVDIEILDKFEKHVNERNNPKSNTNIPSKENNTGNTTKPALTENQTKINITDKKLKIPPINIIDIDTKKLVECLKKGLKIADFQIKEFRNKKALYVKQLDDYQKIKSYLQKVKAKFYTFTPTTEKTSTYLLKGLDSEVTNAEILEELQHFETENLKFVKVSQFATKRSTERGTSLPIFMVQVMPNSNIKELKNIKTIMHRMIYWERLRRPEIPQCRNCQGYFHSAANCFLPSKCVKCSLQHEKGKCPMTGDDDKSKLYCAVCKKYGHPASYKGCEVYKQLQNKFRLKKKETFEVRQNTYNNFVNPESSYANIVKNNENNSNNSNKSTKDFFVELKNMMIKLSSQIVNLEKKVSTQESRIDAIFSIVGV